MSESESAEPVVYGVELQKAQAIARPMVQEKLYKKLEKLMRQGIEIHTVVRGVKEVTKALRKNRKGYSSPIDTFHIPLQDLLDSRRLYTNRCHSTSPRLLRRQIYSLCVHSFEKGNVIGLDFVTKESCSCWVLP